MTSSREHRQYGWHLALGRIDYDKVLEWQHNLVKLRENGLARDTIITVEHPPVVTVGKDGHAENYCNLPSPPIPVERGGDVTYHGPGQLVVYYIFNLSRRGRDLHRFMDDIQTGIIRTLAEYGIEASKGNENTGVWVGDSKIASIGVAVRHWISFHGAAINLNTDLANFSTIQPCGLAPEVMTSTERILGRQIDLKAFAYRLIVHYSQVFGTEFTPVELDALAEDVESQEGGAAI
jgi:lipoate-protein ligase B